MTADDRPIHLTKEEFECLIKYHHEQEGTVMVTDGKPLEKAFTAFMDALYASDEGERMIKKWIYATYPHGVGLYE